MAVILPGVMDEDKAGGKSNPERFKPSRPVITTVSTTGS